MDSESNGFINHPLIRSGSINKREYQIKIAARSLEKPTLVVLPTGLGKTVVALLVMAERIKDGSKVLMVAPTKPLVDQHRAFMENYLEGVDVVMLTGEVDPERRKELYPNGDIVISTPQVIKNDLLSGNIDISGFQTLVVDEAHRAVGDYPYTFIAERFYGAHPDGLILGLTASPGHEVARIYDVCKNLGVENIEVRVDSDPDVKPYIQQVSVEWIKVEVSRGVRSIIMLLEKMYLERVGKLQRMGVLRRGRAVSIKELIGTAGRIQEMIRKSSKPAGSLYQAMSIQAQAMKVSHALELAETQGADALYRYLDRMLKETGNPDCSKATRSVVSDAQFRLIMNKAESLRGESHPKEEALLRFVRQKLRQDPESRIIVFTHFRDTAKKVLDRFDPLKEMGIRAVRFVGQASRGEDAGLSQKEQKRILEQFRGGEYNVLIATSVAEEGLDIPGADLVIFYEPVPSEIRTIQRRGRTGRHSTGRVVVLMSKETRDIAYSWSAKDKESRMERQLLALRRMLARRPLPKAREMIESEDRPTLTIESYDDDEDECDLRLMVDQREMPSGVVEELIRRGVKVRASVLEFGDYHISERVVVERKTVQDLSDSLIDGRLFKQVRGLRDRYDRPVLLIEGDTIFGRRNIKRESLMGALSSVVIDFNVPTFFTSDPKETAEFLISLATREDRSEPSKRRSAPAAGKDLRSIQVSVLSGMPGISDVLAGRLLDRFITLENVFRAPAEELSNVEGIGRKKAREIRGMIEGEGVPYRTT